MKTVEPMTQKTKREKSLQNLQAIALELLNKKYLPFYRKFKFVFSLAVTFVYMDNCQDIMSPESSEKLFKDILRNL